MRGCLHNPFLDVIEAACTCSSIPLTQWGSNRLFVSEEKILTPDCDTCRGSLSDYELLPLTDAEKKDALEAMANIGFKEHTMRWQRIWASQEQELLPQT